MTKMKLDYTAHSAETGDIFAYTIKVHIGHALEDGTLYVTPYKCKWDAPQIGDDGSPQGDNFFPPIETLPLIFPILGNYKLKYY